MCEIRKLLTMTRVVCLCVPRRLPPRVCGRRGFRQSTESGCGCGGGGAEHSETAAAAVAAMGSATGCPLGLRRERKRLVGICRV